MEEGNSIVSSEMSAKIMQRKIAFFSSQGHIFALVRMYVRTYIVSFDDSNEYIGNKHSYLLHAPIYDRHVYTMTSMEKKKLTWKKYLKLTLSTNFQNFRFYTIIANNMNRTHIPQVPATIVSCYNDNVMEMVVNVTIWLLD